MQTVHAKLLGELEPQFSGIDSTMIKIQQRIQDPVADPKFTTSILAKCFDLGVKIPKSKFLGFRERFCMASEQRYCRRTEWNSPFRVLLTTPYCEPF